MGIRLQEWLAVIVTVVSLVALTATVLHYGPWHSTGSQRVVHLSGVRNSGVWTDEEVNGLNYWWKSFRPATIVFHEGEEILLRLSSTDVTHTFYVPELHPTAVMVEAGHVVEIVLSGEKAGEYTYYCTTVCGECHFFMTGLVRVLADGEEYAGSSQVLSASCSMHEVPADSLSFIERGKQVFNTVGCATCHGENGRGGVHNPNYAKDSVPRLDILADNMYIYWEEDVETIIGYLEKGTDLAQLEDNPPIDNYGRFLAQYQSIMDKIHLGAPTLQKKDPDGPEPPLTMPSWREQLAEDDMEAILAYLLTQYPWDEEDDEDE